MNPRRRQCLMLPLAAAAIPVAWQAKASPASSGLAAISDACATFHRQLFEINKAAGLAQRELTLVIKGEGAAGRVIAEDLGREILTLKGQHG